MRCRMWREGKRVKQRGRGQGTRDLHRDSLWPREQVALHAYALMSSHVHLALTAGHDPARRVVQPLLGSVARRLNKLQRRFGPVVGDRATTVVMSPSRMAALVAYLHNNPVRAKVVHEAVQSDWTSHQAWIGVAARPRWLAVDAVAHQAHLIIGRRRRAARTRLGIGRRRRGRHVDHLAANRHR